MLKIRVFGDSVLRKKSALVKKVTSGHRQVLSNMARLMYEGGGIGLAAPQAGISQAMIVVDIGNGLYKLINPQIVKAQGVQVNSEGCLSVPDICIKVRRAKKIKLEALNEEGVSLSIEAEGLLACVFQHEIDHLNGKLIIDYAPLWDKIKIARTLRVLKKRNKNENLHDPKAKSCRLSRPL